MFVSSNSRESTEYVHVQHLHSNLVKLIRQHRGVSTRFYEIRVLDAKGYHKLACERESHHHGRERAHEEQPT